MDLDPLCFYPQLGANPSCRSEFSKNFFNFLQLHVYLIYHPEEKFYESVTAPNLPICIPSSDVFACNFFNFHCQLLFLFFYLHLLGANIPAGVPMQHLKDPGH